MKRNENNGEVVMVKQVESGVALKKKKIIY